MGAGLGLATWVILSWGDQPGVLHSSWGLLGLQGRVWAKAAVPGHGGHAEGQLPLQGPGWCWQPALIVGPWGQAGEQPLQRPQCPQQAGATSLGNLLANGLFPIRHFLVAADLSVGQPMLAGLFPVREILGDTDFSLGKALLFAFFPV